MRKTLTLIILTLTLTGCGAEATTTTVTGPTKVITVTDSVAASTEIITEPAVDDETLTACQDAVRSLKASELNLLRAYNQMLNAVGVAYVDGQDGRGISGIKVAVSKAGRTAARSNRLIDKPAVATCLY